ncbi:substrate-binding domain-containing protein [Vibrio sp. ZSDZ34]|jgi:LacI family transcriptional regulator|uniref:Substrate-binding domain-containing protein n=1 Tax=Vibrio gelatinilyticus TaxID=2893468 RepID=A0A9X1W9F2_9VIBR|nr:substrate-binding domain-containing protein [Vibrio gelatinilyticus]MCJ2376802.1 substrate-binding domain-containing protein [Vibrio gelatinilyticus]
MNTNKSTLEDIAKAATVSISTLSRYLNRRGYVSKDKQKRIQEAMKSLNYQPRYKASSQKKERSSLIGIIIPYALCPHSNAILAGLESELSQFNLVPLVTIGNWNNLTENSRFETLQKQNVAAMVIIGGSLTPIQLQSLAVDIPIVTIGNYDIEHANIINIKTNNFVGGYMATNHLLRLGHSQIAHITGISFQSDSKQRQLGFQEAMKKAGLTISPDLIASGQFDVAGGERAMEKLLSSKIHFTAVFVANDQMAFGAITALSKAGIDVPEQVSVVGFDDHEVSNAFSPALTTIKQPSESIGRAAALKVANQLNIYCDKLGQECGSESVSLIVRESCLAIGQESLESL